jgi:hypothetical protein
VDKRLNSDAAAAYLGVSPKTLWEWRKRRPTSLPCYRVGKRKLVYFQSDLDNYLAECRIDNSIKTEESL